MKKESKKGEKKKSISFDHTYFVITVGLTSSYNNCNNHNELWN